MYWMTWPYANNLQPFIKMYYYNQVLKTVPDQTSNPSLSVIRIKILCLIMVTVWHKEKVTVCTKEPQLLNYDDQRAEMYSSAYRK